MLGPKQLVPSKVCLNCQICCRFPVADSVWQPRLAKPEIAFFRRHKSLKGGLKKDALKARLCRNVYRCSFFNPVANGCKIYKLRPFDCRFYPFVFAREKGRVVVACHLVCPFILRNYQGKRFKIYLGYLKKFLCKEKMRRFLKDNPSLIGDYRDFHKELIILFPLSPG